MRIQYRLIILILLPILIGSYNLKAQKGSNDILFYGSDSISKEFISSTISNINFKTPNLELIKKEVVGIHYRAGYLDVIIDSAIQKENQFIFFITSGNKYLWKNLVLSPEAKLSLSKSSFDNSLNLSPININEIEKLHENIIRYYENHGYPFVETKLDSIEIYGSEISAILNVNKGDLIIVDTILISGNVKISQSFIQNVIGIKTGDSWNESLVKSIPQKLNNLGFLELKSEPIVSFYNQKSAIKLVLATQRSNSFDALLGFYTNTQTNKIELSGNINLKLHNALGKGEEFKFNWQRPVTNNQSLNIDFSQPYIMKSKWGFGYEFDLYRRDSSFVNIANLGAITYRFSYDEYVSLKVESYNSQITLISEDSIYSSSNSLCFGIGLNMDRRNYKFNPSKGFYIMMDLLAGKRKVDSDNYTSSSKEKNISKAEIRILGEKYFEFAKRNIFLLSTNASAILSENLSLNELFRIGGLKTLRGFDEQSLSTPAYIIANLEYRFLLAKNSHISAFYNLGFVDGIETNKFEPKTYSGFGIGTLIDSGAGILSFYLALGKSSDSNIILKNTKVHFGYLIRF